MQGYEVVLALILSLLSVIGAVVPTLYKAWDNRSDTYVRILGPGVITVDSDTGVPVIVVGVINKGARPSFVKSATLVGAGLPILETPLTIANRKDTLVPAGQTSILNMTTLALNTALRQSALLSKLKSGQVKVIVDVEETGRFGGQALVQRENTVQGVILAGLVRRHVSM